MFEFDRQWNGQRDPTRPVASVGFEPSSAPPLPRHLPDWKRAILQSVMSSGSQRSRKNSSSSRGTWWEVEEIIEEDAGKRFRVRWAGKDPKTGKPWPLDWVPNSHCSSDLIKDWEKKKGMTPSN